MKWVLYFSVGFWLSVTGACTSPSDEGESPAVSGSQDLTDNPPEEMLNEKFEPDDDLKTEIDIFRDFSREEFPSLVNFYEKQIFKSESKYQNSPIDSIRERMESVLKQRAESHDSDQSKVTALTRTIPLKVTTLNLGLLCYTNIFVNAKDCDERRSILESSLTQFLSSDEADDVVFLQELWHIEDFELVRGIAESNDYRVIVGELPKESRPEWGLQILIKKTVPADFESLESGNFKFSRSPWEYITHVRRGMQFVTIKLNNGKRIFLGNTHFSPNVSASDFYVRDLQRRQLAQKVEELSESIDYFIFAGDFNFSANFEDVILTNLLNTQLSTRTYVRLMEQNSNIKLFDTFRIANPDEPGFTFDRPNNELLSSKVNKSRRRLDYIFAGKTGSNFLTIENSSLVFTESIDTETGPLHLSDHFGVQSTILLHSN